MRNDGLREKAGESVVAQSFWDEINAKNVKQSRQPHDLIREYFMQWTPPGTGDCLEVGCMPGTYLPILGDLGYRLNGIDLSPGCDTVLPRRLSSQSYRVGEFRRLDFFELEPEPSYDVVFSLGFVEHFQDWPKVIERHAEFVRPGGRLIIIVPNFRGFIQRWIHRTIDRDNMSKHVIDAMRPDEWARLLRRRNFEIDHYGHIGHFSFWVAQASRPWWQKAILRWLYRGQRLIRMIPFRQSAVAPFAVLSASASIQT